MNIEKSTVTKLVISEIESLDPVTVFLEDFEPGKGKITVSCWGKSWTGYWGAMGKDHTVAQFFCSCSDDYIIGCFDSQLRATKFSGDALVKKARKVILEQRRKHDLDAGEARELHDEAGDLGQAPSIDYLFGGHYDLMERLFGCEWWHDAGRASEPNPDYQYLCRIIQSVQQALREVKP